MSTSPVCRQPLCWVDARDGQLHFTSAPELLPRLFDVQQRAINHFICYFHAIGRSLTNDADQLKLVIRGPQRVPNALRLPPTLLRCAAGPA